MVYDRICVIVLTCKFILIHTIITVLGVNRLEPSTYWIDVESVVKQTNKTKKNAPASKTFSSSNKAILYPVKQPYF